METNDNVLDKRQLYAQYVLIVHRKLGKQSLIKKQKKLADWMGISFFLLILFATLVFLLISKFDCNVISQITSDNAWALIMTITTVALIMILIVETRKPDLVYITKICEKADELIKEDIQKISEKPEKSAEEEKILKLLKQL